NTPLDFLLEGSDIELLSLYVDPGGGLDRPPPEHDLAFLAIGECEANLAALSALEPVLHAWPRPVVNARASRIAELTRDGVCALLEGVDEILAPAVTRVDRAGLERMAAEEACDFPVILRPVGAHAGAGLVKVDTAAEIGPYLAGQGAEAFYLAPFVDYAGPDGLYRKQRIALIEGRPFACHLAISPHWMVHYMNAAMLENAAHREEEARFMAAFDQDFAARHRRAFEQLAERIGLDYFAIDCAET